MLDANKYSVSEENYIKAIFHLQEEVERVNTLQLAQVMKTKPASITDMLKKLKNKKLLDYQPYYGFKLTNEGNKIALGVIRRHRIWEYFLAEKLQFNLHEIHELAEVLEHVSSKKLIDKLDAYLGLPKFDPHGDPIPDLNGKIALENHVLLSVMKVKTKARVCRIASASKKIMELISHQQIKIGSQIMVLQRFEFDDSMEIMIDGKHKVNISQQLAKNIFINYEAKKR
ncbi:MAG: metal-dependent transcriptional regulator [Chitinophagaceae bacterium]|jgi:DtxR family Mn-dependent transcriptional regulator